MGHALVAAVKCVPESLLLNSFQLNFLRPVRNTQDITYDVHCIKVGSNFCFLSVEAVQSDKICLNCTVFFQKPQNIEVVDQSNCNYSMPVVPMPHESVDISEIPESGSICIESSLEKIYNFPYYSYWCLDAKNLLLHKTEPK